MKQINEIYHGSYFIRFFNQKAVICCGFLHWKIFPYPPYVSKRPSGLITCGVTLTYFIQIFGRATPTVTPNRRNLNSQCWRQRKTVFRYETSMKFANISGGFGGNLNFELIEDRKSVVQGKSVDLGGRRIIKKKKERKNYDESMQL